MSLTHTVAQQRLLEMLRVNGPRSGAELASLTGLPVTTVSSVVTDLKAAGLVRPMDSAAGTSAGAGSLYEAVPSAGFVFGADVGGTKIHAGIADAYGEILAELVEPTQTQSSAQLMEQLDGLFRRLERSADVERHRVMAGAIGMPGVYDGESDRISAAPNLPDVAHLAISEMLSDALGLPITVDNDVNLAAAGERWRGLGVERQNFVAISIGTGVGMGVVANGELLRGDHGGAGEIESLVVRAARSADGGPQRLETIASAAAILTRLRNGLAATDATVLSADSDVPAIFEAASHGDELANRLLDEEARHIAAAIATVAAVLDPGLVVLGGGVGSNPFLLEPVRRYVAQMHRRPVDIEISALGYAAAFHGAIAMALHAARRRLAQKVAVDRGEDGAK